MKCSVYIATSVDGFIAKLDGDIDWLHAPRYAGVEPPGMTYETFTSTVDVIVMGRNTFEKVAGFTPWPYEGIPVVVVSSGSPTIPAAIASVVRVMDLPPRELLEALETEGKRHVYVDGGQTIQRFLAQGCIDELTITKIPELLGAGIPLFGNNGTGARLRLMESHAGPGGFVQDRYAVLGE